ncbi:threonine synthase [Candidatus Bathyarchaeota archaeon]|nr:threonine synthase [Candidatus Bathyarchaeota archaeon]
MPWPYSLQCFDCHAEYPPNETRYSCKKCGGLLEIRFRLRRLNNPAWKGRALSVWKYRELLPIDSDRHVVTLSEGATGLHRCERLGKELGLRRLYVKNEGENPTGSFKDRGMTVAVSKARELGKRKLVCASTGNTAASLAAYSARAGLDCLVFVPKGKVAEGKLLQVVIHGARLIWIDGDFDKAMRSVSELTDRRGDFYLMNSINPFRLEGQKTLAFEVCDQLGGKAPDALVLPVGNGGNISAIWKGFTEFQETGIVRNRPRMLGVQAEKAAPIARAVKSGSSEVRPVKNPRTLATAIRIGSPVNSAKVLRAISESEGDAETVSDSEILKAQRSLARLEGVFVEPASAASIAGLEKMVDKEIIDRSDLVVCVTTGHGLKDPSIVDRLPRSEGYTLKITEPDWVERLERRL